jgi:hypothetical protein
MNAYSEDRLTVSIRVEVASDPRRWLNLDLRLSSDQTKKRPLNTDYASPFEIKALDGPYEKVDHGYTRQVVDTILLNGILYAFRCIQRHPQSALFEVRSLQGELEGGDRVALSKASSHAALELLECDRACLKSPEPFRIAQISTRGKRVPYEPLPFREYTWRQDS